ncbi:MAG: flagellar basal body L-ring protein FlgH [Planctomycetaceae bacterium]|jgi:carbonic anhydrase|nr:flagellar basal body L-ring protein FlgH [Planctomycetaceae bacterium]
MKRLFCVLTGIALFALTSAVLADDHGHISAVPPQEALKRLQDGNARFVQGQAQHPNGETGRAKETAEHGQHPFATVLACSDSRCPVEIVFDQGIGDIFAIKVAGNVSGKSQLGSIEYGVAHTGTALIVVLGHTQCGAVTAACTGGGHEGSIESLVKSIEPAVRKVEKKSGKTGKDAVEDSVRANVFVQIQSLFAGSEILRKAVREKKAAVIGAVYDITTGKVEFLGEHPNTADLISADPKEKKPDQKQADKEDAEKTKTEKKIPAGQKIYAVEDIVRVFVQVESKVSNDGSKQELDFEIACQVVSVRDNGNLFIEGTQSVHIGGQKPRFVYVSGFVHPNDIDPGNTIESAYVSRLEVREVEEPKAKQPPLFAKETSAVPPAVNAAQPSVRASRPGSFRTFQQRKGTFMGQ